MFICHVISVFECVLNTCECVSVMSCMRCVCVWDGRCIFSISSITHGCYCMSNKSHLPQWQSAARSPLHRLIFLSLALLFSFSESCCVLLFAVNFCLLHSPLFTMNLHFAADTLECEFLISWALFIYICCLVIRSCWEYEISHHPAPFNSPSRTSALRNVIVCAF